MKFINAICTLNNYLCIQAKNSHLFNAFQFTTKVVEQDGKLMKKGSNNFASTNNSGDPRIGEASVEGKGEINVGMLEMSNVDLAEQFTDMIVTQRGFQANS